MILETRCDKQGADYRPWTVGSSKEVTNAVMIIGHTAFHECDRDTREGQVPKEVVTGGVSMGQ